jgi:hypothetical protein
MQPTPEDIFWQIRKTSTVADPIKTFFLPFPIFVAKLACLLRLEKNQLTIK